MESYDKQPHISNIKCHLTKYGAFRNLFWDKMYTLLGSAPKSTLRSQRVNNLHYALIHLQFLWVSDAKLV